LDTYRCAFIDFDVAVCIAITPTSRYCYKSWACDGDVISDEVYSKDKTANAEESQRGPVVVGRERCFRELGGHSWGLFGDNCEKRTDDPNQQPAHYVPDTLHGLLVVAHWLIRDQKFPTLDFDLIYWNFLS